MSIILRKIGGRLTALFRSKGGLAFAGGRSTSVAGFSLASILTSPLVLTVLVIAFVVAWSFAHPVSVVGVAAAHKLTFALAGMAAPITELRQKRATLAKKANDELTAVQAKAKAENRVLTAEELQAQDAYDAQIAAVDQEIQLEERKLDRERASGGGRREDPADRRAERESGGRVTQVTHVHNRAEDDRARGFRSHREFLLATMENAGFRNREEIPDERLRPLAVLDATDRQAAGEQAFLLPEAFTPRGLLATVGSDEQGAYSDAYGGFGVPTTRLPGLLSIGFEGDPTAGRTQPVPMATPSIEIPARTDKNHSTSVSGGFTVSRKAETAAAAASRGQMEMVTMKAASLFGLAYATEEILTDSPISFAALIDSGFRDQFPAHLLNEKIRGNGGNEFTGYLNSPAAVTVAAEGGQAADTINSANIINMASRSGARARSGSRTTTRGRSSRCSASRSGRVACCSTSPRSRRLPRHAVGQAGVLHRVRVDARRRRRHRPRELLAVPRGSVPAAAVGRVGARAVREPRARVQVLAPQRRRAVVALGAHAGQVGADALPDRLLAAR
jgi:HK97 family phage major capsid protein